MRFIGCLLCVCVMAASAGAVLLSLYVVQVTEDPDGKLDLDEQKLKQTSIVYDRDGNEVNTFAGENNRIWREISAMPENLPQRWNARRVCRSSKSTRSRLPVKR